MATATSSDHNPVGGEGLENYKPDDNGLEPLIKDEEGDGGIDIDGGADAKDLGIDSIIDNKTETGNKKKRKNKNKNKRKRNKLSECDSKTELELSGQVSVNSTENNDELPAQAPGSAQVIQEVLRDICQNVSDKEQISVEVSPKVEENETNEPAENPPPLEPTILAVAASAEKVEIDTKPSVKFIFQSEGANPGSESACFIESDTALAEELRELSLLEAQREGITNAQHLLKRSASENISKSGEEVSVPAKLDDPEPSPVAEAGIEVLTPDDIPIHQHNDSQEGWNDEIHHDKESNTSIKIPVVPSPSLVIVEENAKIEQDQAIVANLVAVGKTVADFMNNRADWKEQNASYVGQAQSAVDKILETASSKAEVAKNDGEELVKEEATEDVGHNIETKTSDSMNNLYQVEGDNEYPDRSGNSQPEGLEKYPQDEPLYGTIGGTTFRLIDDASENSFTGKITQSSQGFIVADEDLEAKEQEYAISGELYFAPPPETNSGDLITLADTPADNEIIADPTPTANSETDHENEVFYDAKSELEPEVPSILESSRKTNSTTQFVDEQVETPFIEKIQHFEEGVQKVKASTSKQFLKLPSRKQSEIEEMVDINEILTPDLNGNFYDAVGEIGEDNLSIVGISRQKLSDDDVLELEIHSEEVILENQEESSLTSIGTAPLPYDEVMKIYERPQDKEERCSTFKRGLPCIWNSNKSKESVQDQGATLVGVIVNKGDSLPRENLVGSSEGQEPGSKKSGTLERGLERGREAARTVAETARRWKAASLRSISRKAPNNNTNNNN